MPSELSTLLAELRQSHALVGAEELRLRRPALAATGLPALDALLGGGLPTGRLVELAGRGGGAATSIAVRLLANATTEGWPAALVDRPFAFSPRSAAEAGVDLSRLLWCRPASLDEAARAVDAILGSGAFPLVVLDLGEPREKPRSRKENLPLAEAAWVRLARRAEAARATLVVLADGRAGPGSMAAATLHAVRQRARFSGRGPGRTFEGLELSVALVRNKLGLPPGEAEVLLGAPGHFAAERDDQAEKPLNLLAAWPEQTASVGAMEPASAGAMEPASNAPWVRGSMGPTLAVPPVLRLVGASTPERASPSPQRRRRRR